MNDEELEKMWKRKNVATHASKHSIINIIYCYYIRNMCGIRWSCDFSSFFFFFATHTQTHTYVAFA